MKSLSIRPLSWASAASRRLLSSSPAAIVESSAEIEGEKEAPPTKEGEKEFVPLYRRLSALGGAPTGSVFKEMNKWTREGRTTRAPELMKYVKDLRKYRRYKHALELMDWMVKVKGMNMSVANHSIRIDLMSKVKGIEAAEDYFSKLQEPAKKGPTYGALFNCYCFEKMPDKALALHDKMKELDLGSSSLLYNNLMSLYMKLEQPEKVPNIFQEMKANKLKPDTVTYCIVMRSYGSMNDVDSVEKVLHEMEGNKELVIHWNAYSTLASIYITAGDIKKAESALKKLEGLTDNRDREPFHYLISLYASIGNLEDVNRMWKSLKTTFDKCINMSYIIMLQALNKLDNLEELRRVYDEWEAVYVAYDVRPTNVVISGYLRNGMIDEANSLYAKTKEKEGELDLRTCDLFMGYYLKKKEMSSALKWLKVGSGIDKGAEWKFDSEGVSLFLQDFENAKDVNGLEKFCKILKKYGCLDASAYESLIRTYAAAGKSDASLRQRIEEEKIELNPESKKLLDEMCASEQ